MKFASPGLSGGLALLPLANTRLAETTGSSVRSLRMTFRPLGSVNCSGVGNCAARTEPGFGISFRHGSSALTLWAPPAGGVWAAGGFGRQLLLSGIAKSTTRRAGCRYCVGEGFDRLRVGGAITLDVLAQIVRRSQVVFVAVQAIGLATEAAERLETGDDARLDAVPGAFELARVRAAFGEAAKLLVDDRLELLGGVARPGGRRRS